MERAGGLTDRYRRSGRVPVAKQGQLPRHRTLYEGRAGAVELRTISVVGSTWGASGSGLPPK
ncbi:hypothetical protein GCM10028799_01290 [Kribbella italica]